MRPRTDPIELELFTHRFEAVARQMGEMLRRTALSVNVKERLDFSCALLDGDGRLVVNAPHIPVHLGALGLCVRRVAAALDLGRGDHAVTNHPGFGGSHLPDVTVVTPVFVDGVDRPLAWVASRAHHAEIGGRLPGSMPPDATTLAEEGVVLEPFRLVTGGEADWEAVRGRLEGAAWPSRSPDENLADLAAAVAANHRGAGAVAALAAEHGAARAARIRRPPGVHRARHELDDGTPLAVEIEIEGGAAHIDFTGSGAVHPGNLNATPAVVRSVVLYVLRLMVAEALPLNEGLLDPVELVVPPGILDPPFGDDPTTAPAVVGGNVETSQRLANLLIEALGLAAGSQGTMNNLLFGSRGYAYYETVCGGAGAGPDFDGASAVHTHMTNTAITDPEVLEHRYPVRLESFRVRRGSGGAGAHRGGDGAVRELVFLEPASLSLLTQHRRTGPAGAAGGRPGAVGRQRLVRADGRVEELSAADSREVGPGDRLVLETPGGGGWGAAPEESEAVEPGGDGGAGTVERGKEEDR